jgi:Sulfotransferase family
MTGSAEGLTTSSAAQPVAPDFFIVGHHKSGTTALYQMLRAHPDIYMPELKEPRFFAPDLRTLLGENGALPSSWEQYAALFAPAAPGQRTGEASPSYLRSEVAAELIARARPDARIIAILREPASFVRSLHLHLVREGVETEPDLARAFAAETLQRAGRRVRRYSDHVRYVEQLRRYHDCFPAEQILVLIYDDLRADNESTVRAVWRFLGVSEHAPVTPVQANPAVRVRSRGLLRAAAALGAGRGPVAAPIKHLLPAHGRGRRLVRAMAGRLIYAQPPPADEAVMLELRRRFKGEVAALSDYLLRDLTSLWGYDGLD